MACVAWMIVSIGLAALAVVIVGAVVGEVFCWLLIATKYMIDGLVELIFERS